MPADTPGSRYPDFAGRPLLEWTRADLEQCAREARRDPPKVRLILSELDAADVDEVSSLNGAALDRIAKETGSRLSSLTDVVLRRRRPRS